MDPLLRALHDGARNVGEALPHLQKEFAISDEEARELLPSGWETVLSSRTHWARYYLTKAGCLQSPRRNRHDVTERGADLVKRHHRIDNSVLDQFPEFLEWRRPGQPKHHGSGDASADDHIVAGTDASEETPEAMIERAFGTLDNALVDDLLTAVRGMSPERFELLILDLLRAMGFGGGTDEMYRKTQRSADGGIDGIIDEDALGLDAVYIQAKRYAEHVTVGREAVQALVGSLTGEAASKGVFVTTSAFSGPARDYVGKVQQRIVLIDGDRLARLMIAHEVGVRARKTYTIRSVDEDYFAPGA